MRGPIHVVKGLSPGTALFSRLCDRFDRRDVAGSEVMNSDARDCDGQPSDPSLWALAVRKAEPGIAGWSSPVARQAHNLKVVGSNPTPATNNYLYQIS